MPEPAQNRRPAGGRWATWPQLYLGTRSKGAVPYRLEGRRACVSRDVGKGQSSGQRSLCCLTLEGSCWALHAQDKPCFLDTSQVSFHFAFSTEMQNGKISKHPNSPNGTTERPTASPGENQLLPFRQGERLLAGGKGCCPRACPWQRQVGDGAGEEVVTAPLITQPLPGCRMFIRLNFMVKLLS